MMGVPAAVASCLSLSSGNNALEEGDAGYGQLSRTIGASHGFCCGRAKRGKKKVCCQREVLLTKPVSWFFSDLQHQKGWFGIGWNIYLIKKHTEREDGEEDGWKGEGG